MCLIHIVLETRLHQYNLQENSQEVIRVRPQTTLNKEITPLLQKEGYCSVYEILK